MATINNRTLLMWINVFSVLCFAGYGLCFKIPLHTDYLVDSSTSTVDHVRPINTTITTTATVNTSINSTLAIQSSSTTTLVVASTHSKLPTSSTVLKDTRPTLDEEPDSLQPLVNTAKEKALSRVPRQDDEQSLEITTGDPLEEEVDTAPNNGNARRPKQHRPGNRQAHRRPPSRQRHRGRGPGRKRNNHRVSSHDDVDGLGDNEDSESTATPSADSHQHSRSRGRKNRRRKDRGRERPSGRRRKMSGDGKKRVGHQRKNKSTETIELATETPWKVVRKRGVKKARKDRQKVVKEELEEEDDEEPSSQNDDDDSGDYEDYDEYDEVVTESSKRPVKAKLLSEGRPKRSTDVDDDYDNDGHDDEDYDNDYEDDEDSDDHDYDEDDSSGTDEDNEYQQGDGRDVTQAAANRRARFSDTRQQSTDVTSGSTNEKVASTITDDDVRDPRQGVGGKSMNEFLGAPLRESVPARLTAMGTCNLRDLRLVVQCGDRLVSVCASSPDHPELKVVMENSDGGAVLNSNNTAAYALLRPLSASRRWLVTDRPTEDLLNTAVEAGRGDVPVLRVQSGKRMCRFVINCTRSSEPDEAWHPLPSAPHLPPCTRSPALHARIMVTAVNGTEFLPGTKIGLGEKISVRVEADGDLTGTSLEWPQGNSGTSAAAGTGDGDKHVEKRQSPPILDLHLSKCWVGDTDVNRALLVQDGCSVVDILTNFVEVTENASVFSNVPPTSTTTYNPSRWPVLEQSPNKPSTENFNHKESGEVASRTALNYPVLTHRVAQKAELIAFVMDLSDKKIQISCKIEVCVGQCWSSPSCVTSSLNYPHPPAPVYFTTLTLTTTFTPDTGNNDKVSPTEPSIEDPPTTPQPEPALSSLEDDEPQQDLKRRHPRSTFIEPVASNNRTNSTIASAQVLDTETLRIKTGGTRPGLFPDCIPWWVFMLSITILSLVYIVALFGCVYMINNGGREYEPDVIIGNHTPVKSSYFPEQSSARKRTPQACPERYIY